VKQKIILEHTPTQFIPPLPEFPYRIYCCICRNTIAAAETPIPKKLLDQMQNVPCSRCVSTEDFIERERKNNGGVQ
jgi:hypothetical protein